MGNTIETQLAIIQTDLNHIKNDVTEVKTKLEENYVTHTEFTPVKNVVYGLVAVILTTVVGALVTLVLIK